MMNISRLCICFLILPCSTLQLNAQQNEKNAIQSTDIQNLFGDWVGTLTYIDYSSNTPYSMPCEISISSKRKNRKLRVQYTYPNEPKANNRGKLKISKNKKAIDGHTIISRTELQDGNVEVATQYAGKDGNENKKASIKTTYIIGANNLLIRKEVQFEGTTDWLKRNEYNFKRKG